MREIKFRGKGIHNGEWFYGCYTFSKKADRHLIWVQSDCDDEFWHTSPTSIYGSTVGQFTGLCDKNGVEIYEGDIVKYQDRETAEVTYQPSGYMLVFKSQAYPQCGLLCESWKNDFEVIGNIHERKEEK